MLRIRFYDRKAQIETYDPEILLGEIANIAFAFRYLHYAVLELLLGDPVLFAGLLYMRQLFILVHICIYAPARKYRVLSFKKPFKPYNFNDENERSHENPELQPRDSA